MFTRQERRAILSVILVLALAFPVSYIMSGAPFSKEAAAPNFHGAATPEVQYPGALYSVTFTETGIPAGMSWAVQAGGCYKTSTQSSISFNLANSTYDYFAYVQGENSYIFSGTLTVPGNSIITDLSFQTITFVESGMSSGSTWEVSIRNDSGFNSAQVTNSSSAEFVLANGKYSYCVYTTSLNELLPATRGSAVVEGKGVSIPLPFDTIKFSATGYPSEWGIFLTNTSNYANVVIGTPGSISFYVMPGNYSYEARVILRSGFGYYFSSGCVNTATSSGPGTFDLQNVTLEESGLPSGAYWGVGITNSSILPSTVSTGQISGNAFSLYLLPAKYSYVRYVYSQYSYGYATTYSNTTPVYMVVSSGTNLEQVAFKGIYQVNFQETGILFAHASWEISITIGGLGFTLLGLTPNLTLFLANGTYTYAIRTDSYYSANGICSGSVFGSTSRTVSVKGQAVHISIPFYQVNYQESGMPTGAEWYVYFYVNGTWLAYTYSSAGNASIFLPSYNFTVEVFLVTASWEGPFHGVVENYTSPYLNISTSGFTRTVDFYLKNGYYTVTLATSGKQPGSNWVGELSNSTGYLEDDECSQYGGYTYYSQDRMTFIAQNGTYTYSVFNNYYGFPLVGSGTFKLSGANVTIYANFGFITNATEIFTEIGLPNGTGWGVSIDGMTHSSVSSQIYFTLPLGSYTFEVAGEAGYSAYPGSGVLHLVNYGTYGVYIYFIPNHGSSSPYVSSTVDLNSYRTYTGDFYQADQIYGTSCIVSDPGSGLAYVANSVALYVINTAGRSAFSITTGLDAPSGLALDTYGNTLYVADREGGNIALLNASSQAIEGYIQTGTDSAPSKLLYDSYNHYLYAFEAGVCVLSVINTFTNTVVRNIPIPISEGAEITLSCDNLNGNVLMTDSGTGNVSIISGSDVLKNITVPAWFSITGSAFVASTGYLYLSGDVNMVMVVDLSSGTVIKNITIPNGGTSIAYDPASGYLYVGNYSFNCNPSSVFLIDLSNSTYIGSIPVGYDPASIQYVGPSSSMYVLNMGSDTVSIISGYESDYEATFTETGLPQGQEWSVTFGGDYASSTTSSVSFYVPNGTYDYTVGSLSGYSSSPSSGSLTINGAGNTVSVSFVKLQTKSAEFDVTFTESGLSNGTKWSVTFGGVMENSTGKNITFAEPNGTFQFNITHVAGYSTLTKNGTVSVSGSPVSVAVSFSANTVSPGSKSSSGTNDLYVISLISVSAVIVALALFITKRKGLW